MKRIAKRDGQNWINTKDFQKGKPTKIARESPNRIPDRFAGKGSQKDHQIGWPERKSKKDDQNGSTN